MGRLWTLLIVIGFLELREVWYTEPQDIVWLVSVLVFFLIVFSLQNHRKRLAIESQFKEDPLTKKWNAANEELIGLVLDVDIKFGRQSQPQWHLDKVLAHPRATGELEAKLLAAADKEKVLRHRLAEKYDDEGLMF
jgi:hypothetical protein